MNFIRFWFPVVLYSGIIFYVSSLTKVPTPQNIPYSDKFCHVVEYSVFGFLLARALWNTKPTLDRSLLITLATVGAFMYGLSDEYHQSFVAGRESGLFDVLADTAGGFLGGLTYTWILNFKKKRNY